jgi:hypothetical protein
VDLKVVRPIPERDVDWAALSEEDQVRRMQVLPSLPLPPLSLYLSPRSSDSLEPPTPTSPSLPLSSRLSFSLSLSLSTLPSPPPPLHPSLFFCPLIPRLAPVSYLSALTPSPLPSEPSLLF